MNLPEDPREAAIQAWEQGFLASYYEERGWNVFGQSDLKVPDHLTEDIIEWNPYRTS
jgi:hypothetical protein